VVVVVVWSGFIDGEVKSQDRDADDDHDET
jgi:hypothetical protein